MLVRGCVVQASGAVTAGHARGTTLAIAEAQDKVGRWLLRMHPDLCASYSFITSISRRLLGDAILPGRSSPQTGPGFSRFAAMR